MPEITVVVPVYKAEQFLAECVESILSQTFSDFEVILVEDGSPDSSGAICDAYAAKYEHVSVIHQENRGQAAARNHAMKYAKGRWICFVDSDDLIHPQMLEHLHRAAEEHGAAISMCDMLEAENLPDGFLADRDISFTQLTMDEETLTALYDADDYPAWVACAKLIRRDLIEGYPFREGRVYEDNEAVCRWVCEGKVLAKSREELYFYRGNPDSTTKSEFRLKRLDYLWALESIIGFYTSLGFSEMRRRFVGRYLGAVVACCEGARYLLNRPDVVKQIEKQTRRFLRREQIKPEKEQFEAMLEVMHPELMRFYWPVSGAFRTLREQGISGLLKKLRSRSGRGEDQ